MVPRFTEFYLPVLQILDDIEIHEINQLIEEVANLCQLSDEDRQIMTNSGSQPRYRSNISWAVTDLSQAGFIERTKRGHYRINLAGLAMLDDKPTHPNRDYLIEHSDKFREFLSKKGTRSQNKKDENSQNLFKIEEEKIEVKEEEEISLKELYSSMRTLRKARISTSEIEAKASELEERLIRNKILPILSQQLTSALSEIERELVLVLDYKPGQDVKVSLSRRTNISSTLEAKELKMFEKKDYVIPSKKKQKSSLRVTLPDGKILSDEPAIEILEKVIEFVGTDEVAKLKIISNGMPLIGKHKPLKYSYRRLSNDYFLTTNHTTVFKKNVIDTISKKLNLKISCEIIN